MTDLAWTWMPMIGLCMLLAGSMNAAGEGTQLPRPAAGRPYFMPDWKRAELLEQVEREPWAREDMARIEAGFRTHAGFRQRGMDRWSQTPNLVFKPTFNVAVAGLALQDQDFLTWGLFRGPGTTPDFRWGARRGGYFIAMEAMLRDGAVWDEAPIYPIAHEVLWCMAELSFLGRLYDGRDWFTTPTPGGAAPKHLMDYYIDTAYPIERDADGNRRIRVATYGDGATSPGGDLFLVDERQDGLLAHAALVAAYRASGNPDYAAFVAMLPDYAPRLWEAPPIPSDAALPAAPSRIWPEFGLAMLRSDESAGYWHNPDAIAVSQLMSRGYGHDHRDKLSLTRFGAGRLLYPDYNAIQYENPSIGWTRNAVSQSTLVVDERDMANGPYTIRHAFTPAVKHLATYADGLYPGVEQTRVLLLTDTCLLDVFAARSATPRTFDYLLHSFGKASPVDAAGYGPVAAPGRYTAMVDTIGAARDGMWQVDFTIADAPRAAVRVTAASDTDTAVTLGHWGGTLAEHVAERGKHVLDPLGMLVARRASRRETAFAVVHEPYRPGQAPRITALSVLARDREAMIIRIDCAAFTDYAAVSFGPQADRAEQVLFSAAGEYFAFRDYGWLRVPKDGPITGEGDWTAFGIRHPPRAVHLRNSELATARIDGMLTCGQRPAPPAPQPPEPPEPVLTVRISPETLRLGAGERRRARLTLTAGDTAATAGNLRFDLPPGISVEPEDPGFAAVEAGGAVDVPVDFIAAADAAPGQYLIPLRFTHAHQDGEQVTQALPVTVTVGPVLRWVYPGGERPFYEAQAPRYTVRLDMQHGMPRFLADDDGTVRLRDAPLFTFSDGEQPLLFEHSTRAFTWPRSTPASMIAHAFDRCRYTVACRDDRIEVRMNRDHTQFERAHFTVPGDWRSPAGPPRWQRVVAVDADGGEVEMAPGAGAQRVAAAELAFPGSAWHLAFAFAPPQEVVFDGGGLRFSIGALTGDHWSVGFCRPGELDAWRREK